MTVTRIRWDDKTPGNGDVYNVAHIGHVGTVEEAGFIIYTPDDLHADWLLSVRLIPGGTFLYADTPDELKAEAERWLAEFVSSLGASFPKERRALPEVHACRHCGGEIVPCPAAHRAMIPACKGWKHIQFIDSMPIGAHYCEGRSVRPSAEPVLPHPAATAAEEE